MSSQFLYEVCLNGHEKYRQQQEGQSSHVGYELEFTKLHAKKLWYVKIMVDIIDCVLNKIGLTYSSTDNYLITNFVNILLRKFNTAS